MVALVLVMKLNRTGFHVLRSDFIAPDNNGINDEFFGLGEGYTFYSMFIYDRWGELIFESNDDQYHWDGTFKGASSTRNLCLSFLLTDWQGHDHQYKGIVTCTGHQNHSSPAFCITFTSLPLEYLALYDVSIHVPIRVGAVAPP